MLLTTEQNQLQLIQKIMVACQHNRKYNYLPGLVTTTAPVKSNITTSWTTKIWIKLGFLDSRNRREAA